MARPKGATPPKPANQGSHVGAHVAPPRKSSAPKTGAVEPANKAQPKRTGIHRPGIGGTGKGAH